MFYSRGDIGKKKQRKKPVRSPAVSKVVLETAEEVGVGNLLKLTIISLCDFISSRCSPWPDGC